MTYQDARPVLHWALLPAPECRAQSARLQEGDQARYVAGYWLECQPAKGQIVDVLEPDPTLEGYWWCEWIDGAAGKEREMSIPAEDLERVDEAG